MLKLRAAPVWISLGRFLLQALAGWLVWAATPGLGEQSYLAALALVPFFFSLSGLKPSAAMRYGVSGGLLYIIPGKWSTFATAIAAMNLDGWLQGGAVLLFFLSYCLPFVWFAGLWARFAVWQQRALMPWLGGFGFAALIVLSPSVFPYTPVVMISALPQWIQLADVGGEALLLGLLLTVNLAVFQLLWHALHRQFRLASLVSLLLPLTVAWGYALWVLPSWQQTAPESVSILSLQAQWPRNSSDHLLLRDTARKRPLSAIELTRVGLQENPSCQMVVWPESARAPSLPDRACAAAADLAVEYQRAVLASCLDSDAQGRYFPARLFTAAGLLGEHRKSRLIPLYESPIQTGPEDLQPGSGPDVLKAPGLPALSPSICYEVHFRHDLRQATQNGAQVLVHMANFAVFRHPAISAWDLAMTRLRAVETRRAVVRSVNGGSAGMVLPTGEWLPTAPQGESGSRCFMAPVHSETSMYVRWGDRVFGLCFVVILMLMWVSARRPGANMT